jgi:hypothetical protein
MSLERGMNSCRNSSVMAENAPAHKVLRLDCLLLAVRQYPEGRQPASIFREYCAVGLQDALWRQLDERIGISRELTETSSSKFSGASATRADPV